MSPEHLDPEHRSPAWLCFIQHQGSTVKSVSAGGQQAELIIQVGPPQSVTAEAPLGHSNRTHRRQRQDDRRLQIWHPLFISGGHRKIKQGVLLLSPLLINVEADVEVLIMMP